jgi:hypothetical protein
MPRTVFVISKNSPVPYGKGVQSQRLQLSFPYIYLFILFHGPVLTNYIQLFYTTKPVQTLNDKLYLCNLPNVSVKAVVDYWFCTQYIGSVNDLSWPKKIETILNHLWRSGFNWSSDYHEGQSMFTKMKTLDKRISSFENWAAATKKDPNFTLKLPWKSANMTIEQAKDNLFNYKVPKKDIINCKTLIDILAAY